jgi:hypothetical protein
VRECPWCLVNIPIFHQQLRETISWCISQEIVSDPLEDANIAKRRMMTRQSAELMAQAYMLLAPYERRGRISRLFARGRIRQAERIRGGAQQMMAAADPGSIVPPLRRQLRTEELRLLALPFAQLNADRANIVVTVTEARARLSRESGINSDATSLDQRGGRLLLYAPDENLACGAAEYASKGFFDVNNVPPWDTWVCMSGKYLVSWVPAKLLRLAQQGIDVNPEQCILWADDPAASKEPIASVLHDLTSKAKTS